jgi:hypothetical protein
VQSVSFSAASLRELAAVRNEKACCLGRRELRRLGAARFRDDPATPGAPL